MTSGLVGYEYDDQHTQYGKTKPTNSTIGPGHTLSKQTTMYVNYMAVGCKLPMQLSVEEQKIHNIILYRFLYNFLQALDPHRDNRAYVWSHLNRQKRCHRPTKLECAEKPGGLVYYMSGPDPPL